jgi:ABC-type multidrug transport system permease subunit
MMSAEILVSGAIFVGLLFAFSAMFFEVLGDSEDW